MSRAITKPAWLGLIVTGCTTLAFAVYELLPGVQNQYSSSVCIAGFGIVGIVFLVGGVIRGKNEKWSMRDEFHPEKRDAVEPGDEGKDY